VARILAVDDDIDTLLLIEVSLRAAGHEVETCIWPHAVGELLAGSRFDAVVLDLSMPEISGFELLRELRAVARTRSLPVLILSSHGETADRVRGLREGADDYLAKPFDPDELALRVERLISAGLQRGGLAGDLEAYPLWDLLQSLERSARSGTIYLTSEERHAELDLARGRLVAARCGRLAGGEAVIAALDFERGSFRFVEEGIRPAAASAEALDTAALVLGYAWLRDELRHDAAKLPELDAGFAVDAKKAPALPARLQSAAVERLWSHLTSVASTTRRRLIDGEIAAPLTIDALLAFLAEHGALATAGPALDPAKVLAYRLDLALRRLFPAARRRGGVARDLHLLWLAFPEAWEVVLDLLRQLPAGVAGAGPPELAAVAASHGGSWPLRHELGSLTIHLQVLEGESMRRVEQTLPLCCGVALWFRGAAADLREVAAILDAVEHNRGARGVLILPPEATDGSRLAVPGYERWRAFASPVEDLPVVLELLT
jgi:DNA-binding response OmpR family regulator